MLKVTPGGSRTAFAGAGRGRTQVKKIFSSDSRTRLGRNNIMSANTPRHSRFFWRSSALFGILDQEGRFKEINSAWEKMLELSTGHLLSKQLVDFVHPEDKASVEYYLEQLQGGMVSSSFSCRFRHRNGGHRQILWEVTAAASQEYAFYVVGMDITSRERPSIADEMVSVLDEGVVLQYANGTIGACNPAAERILGLPVDQMIGWTLIDPDWKAFKEDGSPFPSEIHPAICTLRTGQPYSDVVMGVERTNGTRAWLRISAYPLWRDDVTTPYAVVISFSDVTQYKETEHALRRHSEEQSQEMFGAVQGSEYDLWDWDLETNEVHFSATWKHMLGYGEEQLPNHLDSWYGRIHPVDYKRVLADIQNHLEGLTPQFENTHRLQHRDGSYRWVNCRGVAVYDNAGKPVRIIGMHVDITDQRRVEDRLQESQVKYHQVLEAETDAVFLVEAESDKIIETNKSATQIYGYQRDEFLKLTLTELSAQSEKSRKSGRKLAKSTRQRYHRKKDGSVFPVEMTVSPFVHRGRDMFMIIAKDHTERQKIETALWESQSKYRQLFEAASNAIVVFDANTQQVFDVNNVAVDMYGYTKDEWLHLTTEDLSAEQVKSRSAFYSGQKRSQFIPLRWHRKRDGTVFPVEISTGGSYLFQGRSLVCATIRDITERRASEEALRKERDFINTLVQASPAFFFAINPDGSIRMMNDAMLHALGYQHLDEMINKDFLHTLVPEDERSVISAEFDTLVKSMRPSLIECHITGRNRALLVEWHSRAVVQADGSLDFLFGVGVDVTERKEAQGHLRLFKAIIEVSEEAIAITDPEGQLIYINSAYEKLFGRDLETARAHDHNRDVFPPESLAIIQREVRPALKQGQSWSGELDVTDGDGNLFPIWQRVDAVRDAGGKILFVFTLMHNISERKRMWETLRGQWEEYQQIFNNVPVMIWHRDRQNRLLRANKLALDTFGEDDEVGQFFEEVENYPEGDTGNRMLEIYTEKSGKRWLRAGHLSYQNNAGESVGNIIYALDITPYRQQGEGMTAACEEYLRMVLENLPLLMTAFDTEGRVVAWNRAAEEITGYRAKEIVRHPKGLELLFPDPRQRHEMLEHIRRQEDFRHRETALLTKDGQARPVAWSSIAKQFPLRNWDFWLMGEALQRSGKPERQPLDREAMLPLLFDLTRIGIGITDDRGRFVRVNQAYARMYGFKVDELLDQPFTITLPARLHDEAIRDYFSQLITRDEPTYQQRREQHRNGQAFDAIMATNRIILEDGRRLLLTLVIKLEEAVSTKVKGKSKKNE